MTPKQMDKALDAAMQEYAPRAHRRMKANKTLEPYLKALTGRTLEAISEAKLQAGEASAMVNGPEYQADATSRMQTLNSQFAEIENEAIQQAVEEIASLETTASSQAS